MKKKIKFMIIIPIILFFIVLGFICFVNSNNKNFKNNDKDLNYYLEGYTLYKYLYKIDGDEIILAPLNFDKDAFDNFKDKLITYKLSDDLVIYDYSETKIFKKNKLISNEVKYNELEYEIFFDFVNDNGGSGYIWLNDNNEINKIMLYGTLSVYE